MSLPLNILLVEDSEDDAKLALRALERGGFETRSRRVDSAAAFTQALAAGGWDAILADYRIPDFGGLEALHILRSSGLDIPFILVSGTIGEETAVAAMKAGAGDYVMKNKLARLAPALEREIQEAGTRAANREAQRKLAESEARFRRLTAMSSDFYWETDAEHRLTLRGGGSKPSTVPDIAEGKQLGKRRWEVPYLSPDEAGWRAHRARLEAHLPFRDFVISRRGMEGDDRFIRLSGDPVFDDRGAFIGYQGIGSDITGQVRSAESVSRLTRTYALLSSVNAAIVRVTDRAALFRDICRIAVDTGRFRMACVGILDKGIVALDTVAWQEGASQSFDSALFGMHEPGHGSDCFVRRAMRETAPMVSNDVARDPRGLKARELGALGIASIAAVPLLAGDDVVGVLAFCGAERGVFNAEEVRLLIELAGDVGFALDHFRKSEKVNYLAYYDSLTGLANRALFRERLAQAVDDASRKDEKVAVCIMDIERFNSINKTLGRQAGDSLLAQVAHRLQAYWGDAGRLARIGADQFATFLPGVGHEEEVARRQRECAALVEDDAYLLGNGELRISTKAGIALFPSDSNDPEGLIGNAEAALKRAKESEEKHFFHTPELTRRITQRLQLETRLRRALERSEFVLHYQPKIDLATHAVAGVEALLRWQSPDLGLVAPTEFIPLLEETGLIAEVGAWALRRAALDHRSWAQEGSRPPRVAVNISPKQLARHDFLATLQAAIADAGPPIAIDIEITESAVMEDIADAVRKLADIRAMGMGIAIDDFGTGHSSLAYIARLPVDSLKIDRSFIVAMPGSTDAMTLVKAIISLAHSLRIRVVAEGVETEQHVEMLRLLHCDEAQGHLFSEPLSAPRMALFLRRQSDAGDGAHRIPGFPDRRAAGQRRPSSLPKREAG